ncbi:MAG: hypothetical protein LWW85_06825 [Marinilabiliales bacterium]|nr:hypothetical protein [Marinilabiliales bacterium]
MKSSNRLFLGFGIVLFLLLGGHPLCGQTSTQKMGNGGRGVIVGKDGMAFRTNPNGECTLTIPDWLLQRIKKSPNKYRLKISVGKVPSRMLENCLSENAKASGVNDVPLKFSYSVVHGSKVSKGNFNETISKATLESTAAKKMDLPFFSLTNGNEPIVVVSYLMYSPDCRTGEPIPGAEIYVELEPDDEP